MQKTYQTPGGVRSFGVSRPAQFTINTLHGTHPNQVFHPLPPPTGLAPYHLTLESVVPPDRIQQITNAGRLVFHATGDTGGVQHGTPQRIVAMHMVDDLHTTSAAFFYHLGDVVYYNGEASGYYGQFYDPYLHYDAPILAIPGNHDGDTLPGGDLSLAAFVENFCAQTPLLTPEAGLEVSTGEITGTYLTVPRSQESWGDPATSFDTFTLHLKTHRL